MSIFLLSAGLIISVLIRAFFIINGLDVADVLKAHDVAKIFLQGGNPYQSLWFATYPPINYYIETATLFLSNLSSIPFHILAKIWPNLADIITGLILYKLLLKQNVRPIYASIWSLVFLLNPISIIISSAHGQIDAIPSMLVLLSISLTNSFWGALLLGIAIAIKPNPLMFLPLFLVCKKSNFKQKILFALISLAPILISVIPFLLQGNYQILTNVFGYSGVYDFGYAALLRGYWFQQNANIWLAVSSEQLLVSKIVFLVGLFFLTLLFSKSKNLVKGIITVYLLFLGFYFGISAQYLSWILPFAILERNKMIYLFTFSGLIALIGFYLFFGPEILLGKFSTLSTFQSKFMPVYVLGNLILWLTILWWLAKSVTSEINLIYRVKLPKKYQG